MAVAQVFDSLTRPQVCFRTLFAPQPKQAVLGSFFFYYQLTKDVSSYRSEGGGFMTDKLSAINPSPSEIRCLRQQVSYYKLSPKIIVTN